MKRSWLLGIALPLAVAPFAACEEDSNTAAGTQAGPGGSGGGDGGFGSPSAGGNPSTGGGGSGAAAGAGGAGGASTCGDGTVLADEICFDAADFENVGGTVTALAIGDWNGGGADIFLGQNASLDYMAGNGTGSFAAPAGISTMTITGSVTDIAVGHIDSNTNLDVVVGHFSTNARVTFGDGLGGVADTDDLLGGDGYIFDVHIADIAGSGASQDIFKLMTQNNSVLVLTSGAEGNGYDDDTQATPEGATGTLAKTSASTSAVWVTSNGGTPEPNLSWSVLSVAGSVLTVPAASNVALEGVGARMVAADLTGDGNDEIVVIVAGNILNVLVSDGANAWVDQGGASYLSLATGNGPTDIAAGDLDGDGDVDIALSLEDANEVQVFVNDGTGTLTPESISLPGSSAPQRIVVGNLNADAVADIVVATANPGDIGILLSNP